VLQVKPQLVPSQVAVAFAGGEHATHDVVPQLAIDVLLTHAPPQSWKPTLHWMPQFVPSHVAVPFAGTAQLVHDGPHALVDVLMTHAPEHRS
jgi:hypothetical protein